MAFPDFRGFTYSAADLDLGDADFHVKAIKTIEEIGWAVEDFAAAGAEMTALAVQGANDAGRAEAAANDAEAAQSLAQIARDTILSAQDAPLWVSGSDYASSDAVRSPLNGRSYIARSAVTDSATDPANDEPNWQLIDTTLLAGISEEIAATAAGLYIYDTTQDSDGGAWGRRCQHLSWYNEDLNTSARGSRRDRPSLLAIIAEAGNVTLRDADDPSLPMWLGIEGGADQFITDIPVTCVTAKNGYVVIGQDGYTAEINLAADTVGIRRTTGFRKYKGNIAQRADALGYEVANGAEFGLVDGTVNDVAMTVLPDAPIDHATGLPVPTIAVATGGGLSVIDHHGRVWDSGLTTEYGKVFFSEDHYLYALDKDFADDLQAFGDVSQINSDGFLCDVAYWRDSTVTIRLSDTVIPDACAVPDGFACAIQGARPALNLIYENRNDPLRGMAAYIASDYNTGWMFGDIKRAFLCSTDVTDFVGGSDADRSANGNDLTVVGTITRSPVATGADLVAYSGFGSTNYLEQAYSSELDFGTGDFSVAVWVKPTTGSKCIMARQDTDISGFGIGNYFLASTVNLVPRFIISGNSLNSTKTLLSGVWQHLCFERKDGVCTIYVDGEAAGSSDAMTASVDNPSARLLVGVVQYNGNIVDPCYPIALARLSGTAPTGDQISIAFADEQKIFQEQSKSVLFGASDLVKAIAYDTSTGTLEAGTPIGRSSFNRLRRVDNTADAVTTAIAAHNGMVIEQ